MSREIKFRLILCMRIVGYEKWFCGVFTENDGAEADPKWLYSKDNKRWFPEPIFHAQKDQFTGLHDKNGKEIYEDDVVEYFDTVFSPRALFIVDFVNGMFYLKSTEDDEYNDQLNNVAPLNIIGNIYENPELIKKEELQ